uniref:Uncharacterized protein n=1 Tax=Moniliophthora roreri TaxID=221103 RepID=A0A0W0FBW6_MONRR
MYETTLRKFY